MVDSKEERVYTRGRQIAIGCASEQLSSSERID